MGESQATGPQCRAAFSTQVQYWKAKDTPWIHWLVNPALGCSKTQASDGEHQVDAKSFWQLKLIETFPKGQLFPSRLKSGMCIVSLSSIITSRQKKQFEEQQQALCGRMDL